MKKFFLLFSFPLFSYAQEHEKLAVDTVLQEVVVTANRQATLLLNTPYSVNIIQEKSIKEFGFRTAPESLTGSTGVYVQKTNHGGGSPFVRGLTGNQNLILIDGIRLNNSTFRYGPNQYFNTIDVFNIDKLEVVRGTGSVQYGSDAMGGVIQVLTKEKPFTTNAQWHGALYGRMLSADMEYSGRAELSYQSAKLSINGGISSRKFGDLVGGETTGVQSPSGYKDNAYDLKLRWQLHSSAVLTLASQQSLQKNVPLYHRIKLENYQYYTYSPQQRNLHYAKLEINCKKDWAEKIILTASMQQSKEVRSYYRNGATNKFVESDLVKTFGLTAELVSTITNNWSANSGIEYYHDKVGSSKEQISISTGNTIAQRGLYPDQSTNGNFSVYSLHQFDLKNLQFNAGLRFNSFAISMQDTTAGSNQLGKVTVKPNSLVANVGALLHISRSQSIYATFSTGYRAPNIDDMGSLGLVDFRYEIPAYGLKPEKSYNTEIGYRLQSKKWQAAFAFYYMHLTNLVNRVQLAGQTIGGYNVYIKENNQESFIRGFEMDLRYHFSPALSAEMGAAYTFGQNTTRNEPMRRIPPFNGRALLKYQKNNWSFYVENLFASKQSRLAQGDKDDNRIAAGGTPGYVLLNLYGGYQLKNLAIRGGLGNIFNTDYRIHGSGMNGMGRNLSLTISYSL